MPQITTLPPELQILGEVSAPPPLKILEGCGRRVNLWGSALVIRVPGLLNSIIIKSPGMVDFCRLFRVSDVRGPRTKTCVALESIDFCRMFRVSDVRGPRT